MWGSCVAEKTSAIVLTSFTVVTTKNIRLFTKRADCSWDFALATLCSQRAFKFKFVKEDPLPPVSMSGLTTTPHPDTGTKITSAGLHCCGIFLTELNLKQCCFLCGAAYVTKA